MMLITRTSTKKPIAMNFVQRARNASMERALFLERNCIRAAGNRAEALLMAFLQQYDNDDRQCEKKQNDTENNFNSTHIFYLLFKRLNANFIRSLIMIPYKAGFCNRIFCFFPAYSAALRPY